MRINHGLNTQVSLSLNKKHLTLLLPALLTIILLPAMLFWGCSSTGGSGNGVNGSNTGTAGGRSTGYEAASQLAGKVGSITIGGADIAGYKIVVPALDDTDLKGIADGIADYINKISGIRLDIISQDKAKDGPEIVLGNTNRSSALSRDEYDYVIEIKNGDLFIWYGNWPSAQKALDAFIEKTLTGNVAGLSGNSGDADGSDSVNADGKGSIDIGSRYLLKGSCRKPDDDYNRTALISYPEYDNRILRDFTYSVSVTQGRRTSQLTVYSQTSSDLIHNPVTVEGEKRRFCEFAFSGKGVRVDITVGQDVETYSIMPSAKAFRTEMKGNVISVWLDEPEIFMLKINGRIESLLTVFADRPLAEAEIPSRYSLSAMYFDDPWSEPASRQLPVTYRTKTVYIAPGSVLCARVSIYGGDCTILGRGLILDPYGNIFANDIRSPSQEYLFSIYNKNVTVKDIKLVDARTFNLVFDKGSDGGLAKNVKILSTVICTDGISIWNSGNVSVEGCYIHCGDNAVVIRANDGISVTDTYIGTICAALVPSWDIGKDTVFRDIYIFRCDGEGIIKNYTSHEDADIAHGWKIDFENINAVDCCELANIFVGRDVGAFPKEAYIRNIAVPELGIGNALSTSKTAIKITYDGDIRQASNYDLTFENLYVGGKLITDLSQLSNSFDPAKNKVTVTAGGTGNNGSSSAISIVAVPAVNKVDYIYPYKVFIGSAERVMRTAPVMSGGILYLPYSELYDKINWEEWDEDSAKAGSGLPGYVKDIGGTGMVSLEDIYIKGLAPLASYDMASGRISIIPPDLPISAASMAPEPAAESSAASAATASYSGTPAAPSSGAISANAGTAVNLLAERSTIISRWSEATAYKVYLTASRKDAGSTIYELRLSSYANYVGMRTYVTTELKQSGGGQYRLKLTVRSVSGESQSMKVILRTYTGKTYLETPRIFSCTNKWQVYTFDFRIGTDEYLQDINAFNLGIYFANAFGSDNVQIKDISLMKTGL